MSDGSDGVNVRVSSAEQPTDWKEQVALLWSPRAMLKMGAYVAVAYVLTSVLLGLIFQVILFALTPAFARLIIVFTPAYYLAGRLIGVPAIPTRLAKPPTWFVVYSVLYIVFWLAVAVAATAVLFIARFCNQNLICLFARFVFHQRRNIL